jgi:hypothetical protein
MKPRKGDCGTCHWFEPETEQIEVGKPKGQPRAGLCLLRPPIPMQTMIPAGLGPQGPMMKPALQGVCPPTSENRRCEGWRAFGMLPELAKQAVARDMVERNTRELAQIEIEENSHGTTDS